MRAKIIGTGHSVPELTIHNKEFERFLETTDQWIEERTCMKERHIAVTETALSLGTEAARKALEAAGILSSEIDIILCTTATPDNVYPNMACLIQANIDNHTAMCYDINAACSGFLYAASTAQAFIASGMAKTVMVVSAEITSKTVDYSDRSSCILFGDGAAAVIFTASETSGIVDSVFHSDGSRGGCITMKAAPVANYWHGPEKQMLCGSDSGAEENKATGNSYSVSDTVCGEKACAASKGICRENPCSASEEICRENPCGAGETRCGENPAGKYMYMEGRAVYSFATRTVPETVRELLKRSELSANDIDWFVFHQANGRMLEVIAKKLGVPLNKVPMNIEKYGNTSSATIPILLDEMVRDGRIKTGDKIVMSGFGAGLTWGALLLEW